MKCVKCGRDIVEGAKFCPYCGERVADVKPEGETAYAAVKLEEKPIYAAVKPEEEKPIYAADVSGLLKSGKLVVYRDRTEFIASNVQKSVFHYSSLMSVKKGLDRINFIMEDGQTVPCAVNRKNIHEAFVYIENAVRPYIAERQNRLLSDGIRYSFVSSQGLNGGILNIMEDRAEFKSKSGQSEAVYYQDVKSVCISMGSLQFSLYDGTSKAFSIEKEIRDEVLLFVGGAIAPYVAARKEDLLSRGIYYSFPINPGPGGGTVDLLADRVEYRFGPERCENVFFKDVRAARLSMGNLELALTNGIVKTFVPDKEAREDVLAFVENAIRPYVTERTAGFTKSFGIDERIEVNEQRGVFHIIRQGGKVITQEYPLADVIKCEGIEYSAQSRMPGGFFAGGKAAAGAAAEDGNIQQVSAADEKINYVGVLLTIRKEQGDWAEGVRFGNFSLGMSRTNKKYEKYIGEVRGFLDYLGGICPACELIVPAIPVLDPVALALPELKEEPEEIAETGSAAADEDFQAPDTVQEKDQFGIIKYLEGVSRFIGACETPMMIAVQGSWGSGENSVMKMLFDKVGQRYQENLVWFHTWQFTQADFGEGLPMIVGNRLISRLEGREEDPNERAVKVAKGIINIMSGFISQGGTDGQNLTDALFKDGSPDTIEKLAKAFSDMVRERTSGDNDKVIIFVDDLDRLAPAQGVELLETMKNFFGCRGCVFVAAADYDYIIGGAKERYGRDFAGNMGKSFFEKLFQVSFRVPASGLNIQNYVKDKLEQMEIYPEDEGELEIYVSLIRLSVGIEPKSMDRLFNSYLLLKKLADEEMYENREKRHMLFALLCMQTKFREIYDVIMRMKDGVTPDFLAELCSGKSDIVERSGLTEDEKAEFLEFARAFWEVIDTDDSERISDAECGVFTKVFAEVLDFSSITSK